VTLKTTTAFNDEEWHAVAIVYDRANATARIYVDGVAQTVSAVAGTGGAVDTEDDTLFVYPTLENLDGARPDTPLTLSGHNGSEDFFLGELDDIRLYRKALSETEVLELHQSEKPLTAHPGQLTVEEVGESVAPDSVSGLYEIAWTPPRLGVYAISAVATDSAGSSSVSNTVQVRVTEGSWFTGPNLVAGNDGFTGSGGIGGIAAGANTGNGGGYGNGTGGNGGGSSAGGGRDGLGNSKETDVDSIDTDGDGLSDGEKREIGTDPTNAISIPEMMLANIGLTPTSASDQINRDHNEYLYFIPFHSRNYTRKRTLFQCSVTAHVRV